MNIRKKLKQISKLPDIKSVKQSVSNLIKELSQNGAMESDTMPYLLDQLIQIEKSRTLERAQYYLNRLEKSLSEVKTSTINDINLNRWKEYENIITDSLWQIDGRDGSGVHTAGYWGNFIPQIPRQMIQRYTKEGEWVLDCFSGSGTTLIESQRLKRNGIGIELQKKVVETSQNLIKSEKKNSTVVADVVCGNSTTMDYQNILKKFGIDKVQLVILHPPYYDIIKFSDDRNDLSNSENVDHFLRDFQTVVEKSVKILETERYLVIVIGDKYEKGEWIPLGFKSMELAAQCGLTLKSIVVKNIDRTQGKRKQNELWRYRALSGGFYVFKHEYIFILQKK